MLASLGLAAVVFALCVCVCVCARVCAVCCVCAVWPSPAVLAGFLTYGPMMWRLPAQLQPG